MDTNLRQHFDRALSSDPGADPDELAHAAIAQGSRIRQRRNRWTVTGAAAGVATILGVATGAALWSPAPAPPDPHLTIAAAMMPVAAPSCSLKPVDRDATDAVVILKADLTDRQRSAVQSQLAGDTRVDAMLFEDRAQAFERFRAMWQSEPDFVAAVSPNSIPESFRLRLSDTAAYTALRAHYSAMPGVALVHGRICPATAPIGGTL